jgi:hypothetical protein
MPASVSADLLFHELRLEVGCQKLVEGSGGDEMLSSDGQPENEVGVRGWGQAGTSAKLRQAAEKEFTYLSMRSVAISSAGPTADERRHCNPAS